MLFFISISTLLVAVSASPFSQFRNLLRRDNVVRTVALSIPQSPQDGRQVIDQNFQSYSIEFSYMQDFAGNFSQPNKFSFQMMKNLCDLRGGCPIIRAGGSTQNRATFIPDQKQGLNATFSHPGDDQPSSLTIGPAWMESFQQFPNGTKYIYGLNFGDGDAGLNQTVLEATAAFDAIGDGLYSMEIGNEVDGFPGGVRRPANWTCQSYVDQWNQFADAIDKQTFGAAAQDLEPFFQGCAFEAPRRINSSNTLMFNVESAIRDGIAAKGHAKTVSDHDYMGANCEGAPIPTIKDNLLNHLHMTSLMYFHEYLGNFSHAQGVPYVLGETNSISCQGTPGISDVFAASIWSVDYVLYVAHLQVSRLYFHMGTPYRYSAWQPIKVNSTVAQPKPLYYGNLLTSAAFAGGNKQVEVLLNETTLTAYAIYDASETQGTSTQAKLESVVVVNMDMWNSTQNAADRPQIAVQLPASAGDWSTATVQRLTAPGVETANNITFAGQSVDLQGNIVGARQTESINGAQVLVGSAEAVLVSLANV